MTTFLRLALITALPPLVCMRALKCLRFLDRFVILLQVIPMPFLNCSYYIFFYNKVKLGLVFFKRLISRIIYIYKINLVCSNKYMYSA